MSGRKRKNSDDGTPMEIEKTPVYEVAEETLLSGKGCKTVVEKLEKEYPDWKNETKASKMFMIPMVFTDKGTRNSSSGSNAERVMYKALEHINDKNCSDKNCILPYFEKGYSTTMYGFVFHGQRFDEEEVDFVYVSIYGMMVVECKGVKQKRQAGSKYIHASNQLVKKVEKVRQIISSLGLTKTVPIFKIVCFPNLARCDLDIVDQSHVLFKQDLNDLKNWLKRKEFFSSKNNIGFESYVKIALAFLIKYHTDRKNRFINGNEFKRRAIDDSNDRLENYTTNVLTAFYTKEQAELVNVGDHCENLWVTGAAGTGKTLVLKRRAKSLSEQYSGDEENVILVITYNVPINKDIERWIKTNAEFGGKLFRVQTFSALLGHIIRVLQGISHKRLKSVQSMKDEEKINYIMKNNLLAKYATSRYTHTPKFHHILVDEAQDLPGNWLQLLDGLLQEGKSDICIFEDPFQVVRGNAARPRSESARFKKHSLTRVFRNTRNVFEAYQHCRETLRDQVCSIEGSSSDKDLSPPTVDHNVFGLSPEYITKENDQQLKDELVFTLKRLQTRGVILLDVAVITCGNEVRNLRHYLETKGIQCENAEKDFKRNMPDPPIIVESYQRFKGLESKVLIFFIPLSWEPQDVDIYVGFSRSFCHLIVIGTNRVISAIKTRQVESMQRNE